MGHNFKQNSKVIWPGFSNTPLPRQIEKVGRNQLCPCGSGAKYKDCHESDGEVFLEKLARKKHAERVKEERRKLKARGVPWYKRWFVG